VNGRVAAAIGACIVAATMTFFADAETLARGAAASMFTTELAALDRTAGVRDDTGELRAAPIDARIDIEGPAWVQDAAREAVAADAAYRVGEGPHRLTGELYVDGRAAVARWSLERRGWSVHTPVPTVRRLHPALAILPLLAAAMGAWRLRRAAWWVALAAVFAQALSWMWPWPPELPLVSMSAQLESSPLLGPIFAFARSLGDHTNAIAGGVITLCVVLAWMDHRRRRQGVDVGAAMTIVVGALAWCEAAARVSCGPWLLTWSGMIAALALVVLVFATRPRAAVGAA
jgi:hypothetical protein